MHGACTLNSTPNPKSRNSPVLLPGVTPARVGLPKLPGKHPDDVEEEDKVELREGAGIGDNPGGTARGCVDRWPRLRPSLLCHCVEGSHQMFLLKALSPQPLLTTTDARMGTWMIHFLCPELRSQHLREGEALATGRCLLRQPIWAPESSCSDMGCHGHRMRVTRVQAWKSPPGTLRLTL